MLHFNLFQIQITQPIEQKAKYSIKKDKDIYDFVNLFNHFIGLSSILTKENLVNRPHLYD
jgi:hypothetical protein